jgi:hypothetical protein
MQVDRNGAKDREDVRSLATKLDLSFSILEDRFTKEMKPWLPNLERHELTLRLWKEFFPR